MIWNEPSMISMTPPKTTQPAQAVGASLYETSVSVEPRRDVSVMFLSSLSAGAAPRVCARSVEPPGRRGPPPAGTIRPSAGGAPGSPGEGDHDPTGVRGHLLLLRGGRR